MIRDKGKQEGGIGSGKLRVAVACGGTGGHMLPGVQTAVALREEGHAVTLWLSGRQIESTVIEGWSGPVMQVPAAATPGGRSLRSLVGYARLGGPAVRCLWRMSRAAHPDVLLAMGSYSSFGPVVAAYFLRVPVVLHEANAVPGKAISFLSRFASAIGVSFPGAGKRLSAPVVEKTGMPLRSGLKEVSEKRCKRGFCGERLSVLVMGGSQGAQALNTLVAETAGLLQGQPVQFLHLTGSADHARVCDLYGDLAASHELYGYCREMNALYERADLAVCRSGASSSAELALCGVPALFVPHPTSIRQHQQRNAAFYEAAGAADVRAQKDLTPAWLKHYLLELHSDRARLARMSQAARTTAVPDGAERLAALVARTART